MTNFLQLVRDIKQELIARGFPIDGADECARFEITMRVAARASKIDPDVGLLYKPTGNNCRERAVDQLCWKNGLIVDILGKGQEGPNTPIWFTDQAPVDPARWRAPFPDPDEIAIPTKSDPIPYEPIPEPTKPAPPSIPTPEKPKGPSIKKAILTTLLNLGADFLTDWLNRRRENRKSKSLGR